MSNPISYARPFIDFEETLQATEISFYTDASGNPKLGMGGICDQSWMFTAWDEDFVREKEPNIEYLELFAMTAGILAWIHRFSNSRIVLFCDNASVVCMVNNTTSSCKNCMELIRIITLVSLESNVRIFAKHVRGTDNYLSDCLSRLKIEQFLSATKHRQIDSEPTEVPHKIWPMSKIWID